jgi:hypothetical protein
LQYLCDIHINVFYEIFFPICETNIQIYVASLQNRVGSL